MSGCHYLVEWFEGNFADDEADKRKPSARRPPNRTA
jgi:hypothetical protein